MILICHVEDLASVSLGFQQVSLGELVELLSDRVGGDPELLGEFPKIGSRLRIEEKADKQLDTGP